MENKESYTIMLGIDDSFRLISFYQFEDATNIAVLFDRNTGDYLLAENLDLYKERLAQFYEVHSARYKAEKRMQEVIRSHYSKQSKEGQ